MPSQPFFGPRPLHLGIIAAILVLMLLTGMAWDRQSGPTPALTVTPTVTQVSPATPTNSPDAGNADETSGIILAGAFLVLIILGGTLGATRRKS